MSAGEIMKHLIIDPLVKLIKRKWIKVHPVMEKKFQKPPNKIRCFLRNFMENSSIHSFKNIAKSGNHKVEKSIWILSFITSMSLAFMLIREVHHNLKSSEIVMNLEGIPTKVENVILLM